MHLCRNINILYLTNTLRYNIRTLLGVQQYRGGRAVILLQHK